LADYKFRLHGHEFGERRLRAVGDATQKMFGCQLAHLIERLSNGCQGRVMKSRRGHVVESYDGDVFGRPQSGFAQSLDRADGRDVVEGEERRERLARRKQSLRRQIAGLRRGFVPFELRDQRGMDRRSSNTTRRS
jgi:hypothetical protein